MKQHNPFKPENTSNNIQVPGMALRSNAGLPTPPNKKKKAIFFVDANNWYHNVKKYYNPSEIDITKLVNILAETKGYQIKEIRFYASVPSIEDGEETYYNHIAYLDSLQKRGVTVITRKLQKLSNKEILKRKQQAIDNLDLCKDCKPLIEAHFLDLADIKRKEKGIDVWIAVDMLRLSTIENNCDVCVLISGDADFVPALNIVRQHKKEVLTAMVSCFATDSFCLRQKRKTSFIRPTKKPTKCFALCITMDKRFASLSQIFLCQLGTFKNQKQSFINMLPYIYLQW